MRGIEPQLRNDCISTVYSLKNIFHRLFFSVPDDILQTRFKAAQTIKRRTYFYARRDSTGLQPEIGFTVAD